MPNLAMKLCWLLKRKPTPEMANEEDLKAFSSPSLNKYPFLHVKVLTVTLVDRVRCTRITLTFSHTYISIATSCVHVTHHHLSSNNSKFINYFPFYFINKSVLGFVLLNLEDTTFRFDSSAIKIRSYLDRLTITSLLMLSRYEP